MSFTQSLGAGPAPGPPRRASSQFSARGVSICAPSPASRPPRGLSGPLPSPGLPFTSVSIEYERTTTAFAGAGRPQATRGPPFVSSRVRRSSSPPCRRPRRRCSGQTESPWYADPAMSSEPAGVPAPPSPEEPLAQRVLRQARTGQLDEDRLLPGQDKRERDLTKKLDKLAAQAGWYTFVSAQAHAIATGKAGPRPEAARRRTRRHRPARPSGLTNHGAALGRISRPRARPPRVRGDSITVSVYKRWHAHG